MKFKKILCSCLLLGFLFSGFSVFANSQKFWVNWEDDPKKIVSAIANAANEGNKVQDTKFDKINHDTWEYEQKYQITKTLDWIRTWGHSSNSGISPYLQWMIFIGLAWAVWLLIYCWFKLVSGQEDMKSLKTKIGDILIWVLILTWFPFLIWLVMYVVNLLFMS